MRCYPMRTSAPCCLSQECGMNPQRSVQGATWAWAARRHCSNLRAARTHKAKRLRRELRTSRESFGILRVHKKNSAFLLQSLENYFVQSYDLCALCAVRCALCASIIEWFDHCQPPLSCFWHFLLMCCRADARLKWICWGHNVPPVKFDNSNFIA